MRALSRAGTPRAARAWGLKLNVAPDDEGEVEDVEEFGDGAPQLGLMGRVPASDGVNHDDREIGPAEMGDAD